MLYRITRAFFLAATVLAIAVSTAGQCTVPSFDAGIVVTAGGPGPAGEIASADLNGDGRTDILVPRYITNTISLIFGSSTGTPTVVLLTSVQRPTAVGIADFNHDGKLDMAVTHQIPPSLSVYVAVLLGDGAGGFDPPTDYAASLSSPLLTADFNNDGNADVFLGNTSTGSSEMLLGNGSGGLAAPFTVNTSNTTHSVAADLNNDGKLDLASESDGIDYVSVVLGDGTGHFGGISFFPISHSPFGNIAAGDFNNDGKVDLVTSGQSDGISILLGNGSGGFAPATIVSTGFSTRGIATGDFNGDGRLDVTTTSSNFIAVLIGNGNGGFVSTTGYTTNQLPVNVVTGDFNGDTKLDAGAVNCNSCADAATILFGDGNGSLRSVKVLNVGQSPFAIASGDLNADGKVDLAVANIGHNNVSILIGDGAGNFAPPTNFAVGNQPRSVTLGDLNGDQKLDLVTTNYDGGTATILFGDNLGGFSPPSNNLVVPGFNPQYAAIGDFNNDSKPDVAVAYASASNVSIFLGNGAGGFGSPANFAVPTNALHIAVHDFNSDGKADLAVATVSGVSVLLGNGAGGFGPANNMPTSSTAYDLVAADFNRDGKADLAVTLGNTTTALIYTGDGLGGFSAPASFTTGNGPASATLADFNGDRDPDLATGNVSGSASVLLGNGAGGLGAAATYPDGGLTTRSITSGDFNSDGRPDLALANQSGSVSLIFNSCAATRLSVPTVSISDATVSEGDIGTTTATFNVNLSAPADRTVSVSFYTSASDAQKDVDYQTFQGRVTFAPGATTQTIAVPVAGDLLDEFDEHFSVVLAYPLNASISRERGQGTILDNDPPPTVSISDVSLLEGNADTSPAVFTVTLSNVSGKPITLQYTTADGSATAGSDYASKAGTVSIAAGSLSTTITIQVNGDTGGESDETFFVNLSGADNATIGKAVGIGNILNDDAVIQFASPTFSVGESTADANVIVTRTGDLSVASSVDYATADSSGANNCNVINGNASARCDYETTIGTLRFAVGESSKSITIPIIEDAYAEGNENFTITLSNPFGAAVVTPGAATITINDDETVNGLNPIDQAGFFVRQHYIDFLNREPDASGLAFWSNQISECQQPGATCNAAVRRINVSGAFFLSIEFQETGYLVERLYKASYGDASGTSNFGPTHQLAVPIVRLNEFLPDTQEIGRGLVVNSPGWEQVLENNKVAFILQFVQRPRFAIAFPTSLTPAQFVDMLFVNAGVTPSASERASIINEFGGAGTSADTAARARALRRVAENSALNQAEKNKAFVLMQYFGYLRRNPNDPQDTDYSGYDFWLTKLNQFNGNFVNADMVQAFIDSSEYRGRFGP